MEFNIVKIRHFTIFLISFLIFCSNYSLACTLHDESKENLNSCLKKASNGDMDSQNILGAMFEEGKGVKQNYKKALKWYKKAAKQGDAYAQNNLAEIYLIGKKGVNKNYKAAAYWYRRAAKQGHNTANNRLKMMYRDGISSPSNYNEEEKEVKRLERIANLNENSTVLQSLVLQKLDKLHKTSIPNIPTSFTNKNTSCYVNNDTNKNNFTRCLKQAKQGSSDAQNRLAWLYEKGKGTELNLNTAVKWYTKAANQNYPNAQNNLAWMYEHGKGVQQDDEIAFEWYKKAAEQDYARSQNKVGLMYEAGQGVKQDLTKAKKWYQKAVDNGYAKAEKQLVLLNYKIQTNKTTSTAAIETSIQKTISCYKSSDSDSENLSRCSLQAKNGDIDAQINLAEIYEEGIGVKKDLEEAAKWYQKAADNGNIEAHDALEYLKKDLDKERQEKQRLAKIAEQKKLAEEKETKRLAKIAEQKKLAEEKETKRQEYIAQESQKIIIQRKSCKPQYEPIGYLSGKWNKSDIEESLGKNSSSSVYKDSIPYILSNDYPNINSAFGKRVSSDIVKWKKKKDIGWTNIVTTLQKNCMFEIADKIALEVGIGFEDETMYVIGKKDSIAKTNQNIVVTLKSVPLEKINKTYKDRTSCYNKQTIASCESIANAGDALSQYILAVLYMKQSNYDMAIKFLHKSAEQEFPTSDSMLALAYNSNKNYKDAAFWYQKAAEQGDANAQNSLGKMHEKGQGFQKNPKEALKWYEKAAEQGNKEATSNIASLYYDQKDYKKAALWYQKAAEQGGAYAQYSLGWMYDKGKGVQQDSKEALNWYEKAAAQGNKSAKEELSKIAEEKERIRLAKESKEKERQRLAAEKERQRLAKENEDNTTKCYKVTGLTKGMAEAISEKFNVSVRSITFYGIASVYIESHYRDCRFEFDTPKGIKRCNGSVVITDDGSYIAHGSSMGCY